MQSFQNLGLALATLFCGVIVDKLGFLWLEMFYLGCLAVAMAFCVVLFLLDGSFGQGILCMGPKKMRRCLQQDLVETKRTEEGVDEPTSTQESPSSSSHSDFSSVDLNL